MADLASQALQYLVNVGEKHINQYGQFGNFIEKLAWTVADRFIPEAREGYPYVMYDTMSLAANAVNIAYPAASFSNPTTDELVIDSIRFEVVPAVAWLAGGGLGLGGGANDYNVLVTIKDMAHNATFMQNPVPIGMLVTPTNRLWVPPRKIILPGGNQSALQISLTNTTGGILNPVYCAVNCHARSRKNTPQ